MLLRTWLLVFGFITGVLFSQYAIEDSAIDTNYLEDQFYTGLSYNFFTTPDNNIVQRNFSYGLQLGFIKDIPFTKRRNIGAGIGLGYAFNNYYSNITVSEQSSGFTFTITDPSLFTRSKFETHALEIPVELRWRSSTATSYEFWRIYTGIKINYNFSRRSKLVTDNGSNSFSNNEILQWNYGLTLNLGYNTFNLHLYYGLNTFLKDGTTLSSGNAIDLNPIRIGLIFYAL